MKGYYEMSEEQQKRAREPLRQWLLENRYGECLGFDSKAMDRKVKSLAPRVIYVNDNDIVIKGVEGV